MRCEPQGGGTSSHDTTERAFSKKRLLELQGDWDGTDRCLSPLVPAKAFHNVKKYATTLGQTLKRRVGYSTRTSYMRTPIAQAAAQNFSTRLSIKLLSFSLSSLLYKVRKVAFQVCVGCLFFEDTKPSPL